MRVSLNRDKFLKERSLNYNGRDITVLEIIKACAHVMGGVHSGSPEEESDEDILDLDEICRVGGMQISLVALKEIVQIALDGLQPLTNAITRELGHE